MKQNDLEEFDIPGGHYFHITHGKNNLASKASYSVWMNGGCIGSFKSLRAARGNLFDQACLDLARRIKKAEADLATMEKARATLANDPFNLGHFKVRAKRRIDRGKA